MRRIDSNKEERQATVMKSKVEMKKKKKKQHWN